MRRQQQRTAAQHRQAPKWLWSSSPRSHTLAGDSSSNLWLRSAQPCLSSPLNPASLPAGCHSPLPSEPSALLLQACTVPAPCQRHQCLHSMQRAQLYCSGRQQQQWWRLCSGPSMQKAHSLLPLSPAKLQQAASAPQPTAAQPTAPLPTQVSYPKPWP